MNAIRPDLAKGVIDFLIEKAGPDILDARSHPCGARPLHLAAAAGNLIICVHLVKKGADFRIKCDTGRMTPVDYSTTFTPHARSKLISESLTDFLKIMMRGGEASDVVGDDLGSQLFDLGVKLYKEEMYKEAVSLFDFAAEKGCVAAKGALARCYSKGRGVDKDLEKAYKLYDEASKLGDIVAINNLGVLYQNGEFVKVDKIEAFDYFSLAAEYGNAAAQYNLALCYFYGIDDGIDRVVEKSLKDAAYWLKEAASQGYEAASELLRSKDFSDGLEEERQLDGVAVPTGYSRRNSAELALSPKTARNPLRYNHSAP